jgi:hypothetical protein
VLSDNGTFFLGTGESGWHSPGAGCTSSGKAPHPAKWEVLMRWSFSLYMVLIFVGLAYMAAVGLARG